MLQHFKGIHITALKTCVPSQVVSNAFFEELLSPKEIKIFEKTVGIKNRRWATDNITALDLGFEAANSLLKEHDVASSEVECLIFLSQTPDYKIPFSSNILQAKLNLPQNVLCLDINAGCAGFVQGLGTAFSIAQTIKGKVLFIVAETLSKILSHKDRGTSMLFGDGAAAMLIERSTDDVSETYFQYFSDGNNADAIMIPDGGCRNVVTSHSFEIEKDDKNNQKNRLQLAMDGARVLDFTLREVAPSILQILKQANLDKEQIGAFLLHQSNQFIIKQIAAQLGVEAQKFPINIDQFGNTSGVSIPLLIQSQAENNNELDKLILSGYGSGLNWANGIISFKQTKIYPQIEL